MVEVDVVCPVALDVALIVVLEVMVVVLETPVDEKFTVAFPELGPLKASPW